MCLLRCVWTRSSVCNKALNAILGLSFRTMYAFMAIRADDRVEPDYRAFTTQKSDLTVRMRTHTGERSYTCTEWDGPRSALLLQVQLPQLPRQLVGVFAAAFQRPKRYARWRVPRRCSRACIVI